MCGCSDWTGRLIILGYFPVVPNAHTAISLDVLELFQSISTHGSFSKQGFARGLEEFHRFKRRREGCSYTELFRSAVAFWIRTRLARDDYTHNAVNAFFRRKELEIGRELNGKNPIVLGTGSMQTLCPSCFHRISVDDESPAVLAIDGNMQHSRLKHVAKRSAPYLDAKMFFPIFQTDRDAVEASAYKSTGESICDHNFKGSTKPHTMQYYDETGLLLVACR